MRAKKWLIAITLVTAVLCLNLISVAAEELNSTYIIVNNQNIGFSTPAANQNGEVYVPAAEFVKALGGTFNFDYATMKAVLRQGANELIFRLDSGIVQFNGKYINASVPFKILNNRFMIPAFFTGKILGAEAYTKSGKNQSLFFQPSNGKLVYKVVSGDTLWLIADTFKTTIPSIRQLNGISGDMIYVGQQMVIKDIPSSGPTVTAQTVNAATIFSAARLDSSAVDYLKAGTGVTVTGKNGDWYKVITPKGNGYIYYTVISVNQDISGTQPASQYFNGNIPVDTAKDTVTHIQYTVKKGDYIWAVAEKFGIPDYELMAANNFSSSTVLYIGQVIKVPVHNIPVKETIPGYGEVLDWSAEGQYLFPIGKTGKFTDIATGKSFMAKRTLGASHADTEVLTAGDAAKMKEIFGGSWTWSKRPFILEVDGRKFAVSVSGMPHAGVDGLPFLQNVSNRSDNWGYGPNYDSIAGNGMNGHFDVYFLNCLRHNDNKTDPGHQYSVMAAGGLH